MKRLRPELMTKLLTDGWTNKWMKYVDENKWKGVWKCIDGWMNGSMDEWMDRWMNELIDGWMNW